MFTLDFARKVCKLKAFIKDFRNTKNKIENNRKNGHKVA